MSTLKVNKIIPTAGVPTDGGGGIVQVKQTVKDDTASTSSNSESDLMNVTITPTSNSSKILIFIDLKIGSSSQSTDPQFFLYRNSTKVYYGANAGNRLAGFFGADEYDSYNNAQWLQKCVQANYLDSPGVDTQVTYTIKWRVVDTNHTLYLNRTGNDNNSAAYARTASSITVMEVSA